MKKKVTIVIPFYNVEDCFERCLESVARQTYPNIEAILVDDCGKDNSRQVAESFIKNYKGKIDFRILTQEYNQGLSAARNRGIREARGEYLYFLDSDDYISDDCIEVMYAEIENDPDVQMVISNYKIVGPLYLGVFCMQQRIYTSEGIVHEQLTYSLYTMGVNKLISREFLLRNNLLFKPGIVHEDNLWSFCMSFCLDKIAVVLKYTYFYIIRKGSIISSNTRAWHQQNLWEVYKSILRFIFESDAPDKKNVKSITEVFRFMENDLVPFIMEPMKLGDETLAFSRYEELRSLPYWSQEEIKALDGIEKADKKKYKHFTKSVKSGFRLFCKNNASYTIPQSNLNSMKVSVITINYNNIAGLKRTVPSILAQTYTGYEFVVIDGGSTDGSKEYLQAQERIDILVCEPDKGIYNAMNKGVAAAHGEYCIFMNSGDEFFSSEALMQVVGKLQGKDFYTGRAVVIDKDNVYPWNPPYDRSVDLFLVNSLNHQATFNRTAFLKEHPFNEDFKIVADWDVFTRTFVLKESTFEPLSNDMIATIYLDGISVLRKDIVEDERKRAWQLMVEKMPSGKEKEDLVKQLEDFYVGNYTPGKLPVVSKESDESRRQRHKHKLQKKIAIAMELPPLQRDWKIARNALKMFFRDLFV